RNYRERARNKIRRGFDLLEKAEYYRSRAATIEENNSIFSDDPDATQKLEDRITQLEKRQQLMKDANKLVRKQDRQGLAALGFSEERIDQLFKPDFCGRIGFADCGITNNGANIRRLKERLKVVSYKQSQEDSEE